MTFDIILQGWNDELIEISLTKEDVQEIETQLARFNSVILIKDVPASTDRRRASCRMLSSSLRITMTEIVCITGSRKMSERMKGQLIDVLRNRALPMGWKIVCGDASGIDTHTIWACEHMDIPLTVYHTHAGGMLSTDQNIFLPIGAHIQRDRVLADVCTRGIGFWNGHSRGTKHTLDFIQALNKRIDWWDESKGKWFTALPKEKDAKLIGL